MRFNILGALIAASMTAFSGVALSTDVPPAYTDAISINKTYCHMYFGASSAVMGTTGRVFVKFDVRKFTVYANCTITASDVFLSSPEPEEDFRCYVQITNLLGHYYQTVDSDFDPDAKTTKRLKNGKATMSCSGTYYPPPE